VPAPESIPASRVVETLEKHVLVDGFRLVVDLARSRGSRFVDATSGRTLIDLYSSYASMVVGFNHPALATPAAQAELLAAAKTKVANADVYSVPYATFVDTFARVVGLPPLQRYFFIDGGALAVENALKAAMDWKVRRNLARGKGERGTEILHFEGAFHGRSGYTMSLTNTDPRKTDLYPKFPWPRVRTPRVDFSLPPAERDAAAAVSEAEVEREILEVLDRKGDDIAAIVVEPIQGEGGDRHLRGEFLRTLRRICDERDLLLIFDEVQCGMGITGRNWCCEHFDVVPDLLAFGKKSQVCGVMAGPRLDEVKDNVFRLPSRINSTWGGNLVDMVRATHLLRLMESERLVENARRMGDLFRSELEALAADEPIVTQVRGRGLMLAFSLPDGPTRDAFWKGLYEVGLLTIRCGERSIRLRPVLDVGADVVADSVRMLREECRGIRA
jgi:L-lysine 6-transaminase